MNSIAKFFKNIFASQRELEEDVLLQGHEKADAILQLLVKEKKVPGIAITVISNNEICFEKGYGFANIDLKIPIVPQKTIFRIASVSKPIAATALALMVHESLIDLDASFYSYVPYFPKKKWDFSIRQLASHTAGIRAYKGIEYGLNKPFSIKESIALFKDDDLLFEPGTDYLYNSFDWVLISLAMQEVSGVSFEAYVYDKVLQPLEMRNTFAPTTLVNEKEEQRPQYSNFTVPSEQRKFLTSFYSKNKLGFRQAIPVNNHYKLAGGGYLSTSSDIATFGKAILDNVLLDKGAFNEFLSAQVVDDKHTYYGLGWQVSEDKKGRTFYGHVGNGVGGYSNFFVYPQEQLVIAILINCTDPKIQPELDKVVDALIADQQAVS